MTQEKPKENLKKKKDEIDEEEVEKMVEDWTETWSKDFEEKFEKNVPKYIEPLAGVILMTIFLILVNLFWDRFDFITDDFEDVLPIYNAALLIGIILNGVRVFIHNKTFKVITDIINTVVMFYVAYVLWTVYPFDVSGIWDILFKILIVVPPFLMLLAVVVDIGKLIAGSNSQKESKK